MDFGSLPPEVNSARLYTGAGPGTLLAASASWDSLAAELLTTAAGYQSVITGLTEKSWIGPSSMSMEAAVAPYLAWMTVTAAQCDQAATQATAAASAYEAAYAMTVPPPLVLTNRVQLATLVATNVFGQNTPAIMATEAEYSEMWAQDATAMYTYAANSAVASTFKSFASPPQTTNSSGLAAQAGTATQTTGTQSQSALMSAVSQALQGLSTPASSSTLGGASGLASTGASAPTSALSSLTGASGKTANTGAAGVLSNLGSLISSLGDNGDLNAVFDVAGLGGDVTGLGTDFGGLGLDFGGIGIDVGQLGELPRRRECGLWLGRVRWCLRTGERRARLVWRCGWWSRGRPGPGGRVGYLVRAGELVRCAVRGHADARSRRERHAGRVGRGAVDIHRDRVQIADGRHGRA